MPGALSSSSASRRLPTWLVVTVLALVVANYVALTLNLSARWEPWGSSDAAHYLHIARRIHDGKGFTSLGPEQFHVEQGMTQHPETNRQPIYPYLISLLAGPDRGFIIRARLLNIAIGAALLLATFFLGRTVLGERAALVGVTLFGLADFLLSLSGEVLAEPLAALWFLLFLWCAFHLQRGYPWWAAAGAAASLAWLTKGTGLLLVVAFIVMAVASRLSCRQKLAAVIAMGASFVVIASPLMYRNFACFGDPLYNMNTRHVMWTEGWEVVGGGSRMLYDASDRPTMARYLATHSPADIVARQARGLPRAAYWLTQSLAARVPNLRGGIRAIVGAPLLLLALVGLYRERRREPKVLVAVLLVIFWFPLAWYSVIGPSHRFWFPLLPILFIYTGGAIIYLRDHKFAWLWPNMPLVVPVLGLVIVFIGGQLYAWRNVPRSPFQPPPQPTSKRLAEQWEQSFINEDDVVFGTSSHRTETFIPSYRNFVEFQVAAKRLGVDYLVLNTDWFQRRSYIFGDYIQLSAQTQALSIARPLPGWGLVYQTPQHVPGEPYWLIFRQAQ